MTKGQCHRRKTSRGTGQVKPGHNGIICTQVRQHNPGGHQCISRWIQLRMASSKHTALHWQTRHNIQFMLDQEKYHNTSIHGRHELHGGDRPYDTTNTNKEKPQLNKGKMAEQRKRQQPNSPPTGATNKWSRKYTPTTHEKGRSRG